MRENLLLKVIPRHLIHKMKDLVREKFSAMDHSLFGKFSVKFHSSTSSVRTRENRSKVSREKPKKPKKAKTGSPTDGAIKPKVFQNLLVEKHENVR